MSFFRTISQTLSLCVMALCPSLAHAQPPSTAAKQCVPQIGDRRTAQQSAMEMFAALVPARDSTDAPTMYLATLLQEVHRVFSAPDTIARLSDGAMSVWLHSDGRLTNPRATDTLLPRELLRSLTVAIDSVTRSGGIGPVFPLLRTDSVDLRLIVHYADQRTLLSLPLIRVALPAVYFEFQVEKPAMSQPGNAAPKYPTELREANIQGEVLVQFVVDQTGRPEMRTFKILMSSHPDFSTAVRQVLPRMRFYPAELSGCAVRQLVQLPFAFRLNW